MSNIADRVRTAQDKDGMLRRALERIIQLYTDITLGVDEKVAQEDACKLEHDLSQESFDAICAHALRTVEER